VIDDVHERMKKTRTRRWIHFITLSVTLVATGLFVCQTSSAQQVVVVNQLGYRPDDTKIAWARNIRADMFELLDAASGNPVYRGKNRGAGRADPNTGDTTYVIDFSAFKTPGRYQLWIPGTVWRSSEFRIADDVYDTALKSALESFYYQRCGTAVENGTMWRHPPCHLEDAPQFENSSVPHDVSGGWHDAGDYGKFVVTGTMSAALLLYLYENQPEKFYDGQLNNHGGNNGIPDILDEVRWELAWLLKMQGTDGGVYFKVSKKKWTGEHLPHTETDVRYIFDVSTTATGGFAAVTALGTRLFMPHDPDFAQRLLRASTLAWKYLQAHPSIVPTGGFRNPAGVEGGEYSDDEDGDERLWASAELYRTTNQQLYHQYFLANFKRFWGVTYPVSYKNVQNFAFYSYVRLPLKQSDQSARNHIIATVKNYCDDLLMRIGENGYRHVLKSSQFYWGSNAVTMGYAFDLLQGYDATRNTAYLNAALDQLHFILGRNAFGISFVTGVGAEAVKKPYHQFSIGLKSGMPVPGMLVGGPNSQDRIRGKQLSAYPGKCYEDSERNWVVNEPAINYTAPFVYVVGYFAQAPARASTSRTSQNGGKD
jgi:endoglucanase